MRFDTLRTPLVFRLLDIVAVVSLLLAITALINGGFREWTPFGRISVTSWIRPLVIALVALGVRHWWMPRPTIVTRLATALRRAWLTTECRVCLPIAIGTRTAIFVVGFLAIALFGFRTDATSAWRIYDNEVANLPARWDTGWYMDIALDGYKWNPRWPTQQQNIAFFPVYPMLMRYGSLLFARETMWTGVLIAWAAFFAALVYLFRLAREQLGDDDKATATVAFIACYPFALYFGTAYSESLFLLTIVAACYHFQRDEMWQAAVWGLLAGLTRPNGCLLSIVLALMAIRPAWPADRRSLLPLVPPPIGWAKLADRIAVAATPGIGMLIYSTYIYFLTGHPLQWAIHNAAWGRVYRSIDSLVTEHAIAIGEHGIYTYTATRTLDTLQIAAVLFVLATAIPVYRRFGLPFAALIVVNVGLPLMMGGLLSMGRLSSVLFPTFLWMGAAVPATHRIVWLAIFAMLQALCAALFFTWRPLY